MLPGRLLLRILGAFVTYMAVIGLVLGGVALIGAGDAVTNDPVGRMVAQIVLALVVTGAVLLYAQRVGGVPRRAFAFTWRGYDALAAILLAAATILLGWGYVALLEQETVRTFTIVTPTLGVLLIGIIGEFGVLHEEVLNRGYYLPLLQRYGAGWALLLSALLFMLGHIPFKGVSFILVGNFLGGLAFGYVYLKSGSLWSAVIVHAAHNFATDLFFTGSNEGVSVGIGLFQFTPKLAALERLPYDLLLMLLLIGLAYLLYGRGTGFFTPAARLRERWASLPAAGQRETHPIPASRMGTR